MRDILSSNEADTYSLSTPKKLLSSQEEVELAKRIEDGDTEAREKLICANLRLVKSIAANYKGYGTPVEDLVQAGNIGLINAADKFDYRKKRRFSTYATFLIKKEILEELRKSSNFGFTKLPKHLKVNFDSTYVKLYHELLREPTRAEIAEALKLTSVQVEEILVFNSVIALQDSSISNEQSETTYKETVEDFSVNIEDNLINKELIRQLQEIMSILPDREREIIRLKFEGVKGTEIADRFDISSARVTQLYQSVLQDLKDYLLKLN
ncbi:MAG: sigma-70 family RNA polymerase sigma factor [Candidatus Poribacteria bacterium]|nr:sigma-70 family RNA polymerase sigma factor [Candidatus Poribacteria bacterium]